MRTRPLSCGMHSLSLIILFGICHGEMGRHMEKGNCYEQSVPTNHSLPHPLPSQKTASFQSSSPYLENATRRCHLYQFPDTSFLSGQYFPQFVNPSSITSSGIFPCFFSQASRSLGISWASGLLKNTIIKTQTTLRKSWINCLQNKEICFDQLVYTWNPAMR